jgi:hypothetical protein
MIMIPIYFSSLWWLSVYCSFTACSKGGGIYIWTNERLRKGTEKTEKKAEKTRKGRNTRTTGPLIPMPARKKKRKYDEGTRKLHCAGMQN